MASNWSLCGVCDSLGVSKSASVWCSDCDEGLCCDCEQRHNVSRGTKSHLTVPVDKYKQLPIEILRITQTCTKHNNKFQTYCKIHDCPCCHKCVIETHNTCKDLKAIDDVVKNVKSSYAFSGLEESLKELSENVTKAILKKESNISSLRTEKQVIENEISDVRIKVNKYLDCLQVKLLKELEDLDKNENDKIRSLVTRLKERESVIVELQDTLCQIKEHATELQIFLAMKGIENDVRKEEQQFKSLHSTADANEETHLILEVHKTIQQLEKEVKIFGQIRTQSKPIKVTFERKEDKQAQLTKSNTVTSVKNISLSKVNSFTLDFIHSVKSSVLLPSGIAAIICESFLQKKTKLFGIRLDGFRKFEIPITLDQYGMRDMTYVPSINSLAVLGLKDYDVSIQMFDIQTKKITKSIPVKSNCHGISYKSEDDVFLIGDEGIHIMNLSDKSVNAVKSQQMIGAKCIASFKENVYYTKQSPVIASACKKEKEKTEVYSCDLQGKSIWSFKATSVLRNVHSITVGSDGSVYVAGHDSNNIVVIQSDGTEHAEILSFADGLRTPVGIDYDRTSNQLLVVHSNDKVFLYKVNIR